MIVLPVLAHAQNLVPNPGFETMVACPANQGEADFASAWFKSAISNISPSHADYMNACSPVWGVPFNPWGTEPAASGVAYMAITTKVTSIGVNYRENIYAQLISPLVPGTRYNLSFKLSLCDNFMLASDKMGLTFSTNSSFPVNNQAALFVNNPVTQQNGWVTVSGEFIADSAYTHIGVGNFFDDQQTTLITACNSCPNNNTIYYIDDILVSPVTSTSVPVSSFQYLGPLCANTPCQFNDNSSASPTSWFWSVSPSAGVLISNPNAQNPQIVFPSSGTYTVYLSASNASGTGNIFSSSMVVNNCQVGLRENQPFADPLIYPNPSRDLLQYKFSERNITEIHVLSNDGRLIQVFVPENLSDTELTINVSSLDPGSYVLVIKSESGSKRLKFTKWPD